MSAFRLLPWKAALPLPAQCGRWQTGCFAPIMAIGGFHNHSRKRTYLWKSGTAKRGTNLPFPVAALNGGYLANFGHRIGSGALRPVTSRAGRELPFCSRAVQPRMSNQARRSYWHHNDLCRRWQPSADLERTRRRPLPGPPCGGDRQQTVRLISAAFGRNSLMGKSLVFGCSRAY